ncbi:MAG: PEP-CTERM sorting domain-containing protein [Armatimonadota bacterium]|nr:PEP-CTERM sorting domain-containing protein [Armatimonadota bacterium]
MRLRTLLPVAMIVGLGTVASAQVFSHTWDGTEPTRLGRLFRDGVPSNHLAPKPFPGVFNPTGTYYYYQVNMGGFGPGDIPVYIIPTIQPDVASFVAAYHTAAPGAGDMSVNYLGDQGGSVVTNSFSVILPGGTDLWIFITTTSVVPGGIGSIIEGTVTTVPEPGTFIAIGIGLAGLALARRRK